jgi:chromosome condensin MukBEF ATPase and DNA-binding subunit MukB
MPMTSLERDVGALEARMETVEQEIHAMRKDVREIRDALVTARGGWRTLTLVVGVSASVGAALAKLAPLFAPPRL